MVLAVVLQLLVPSGSMSAQVAPHARRSSLLSRTGMAVLRRQKRLARAEASLAHTTANATQPVYAAALNQLKLVESAVANLTKKFDNLTAEVLDDEAMIRNVSENLTAARKMLYAAEWVVRSNKWMLGKSQVELADSNTSLGNAGYKQNMTGPQTKDVGNGSHILAVKANISATPENLTAIENVETALWNTMKPQGKTSIDKFEEKLTKNEKAFKEFKVGLDKEVRRVLAGKSKAELDKLRRAIFHLGAVSSGVIKGSDDGGDDDEEGGGDLAGGY